MAALIPPIFHTGDSQRWGCNDIEISQYVTGFIVIFKKKRDLEKNLNLNINKKGVYQSCSGCV